MPAVAPARRSAPAVPDSRFRSVVETMSDGVVVQNVDGSIELCNARALELFGVTEAELRASFNQRKHWHAVRMDGSPFPCDEFPVNLTRRTGEPQRNVVMGIRRRDGESRWLSVNSSAVHTDGRMVAVVCTFGDLTDRAELASQLRQAQKMEAVGQLAGGIAHDFNNLLTAISCNVELLLAETAPNDTRHEDVVQIREAADRAATLTRQLLAFSRRQVVQPTALDLNLTVAGMERLLRRVLNADVHLHTQLDPALPPVFADAGQMEQVMMNLVLNARDAMPSGGTIAVRTSRVLLRAGLQHRFGVIPAGEYVVLSVEDAGTGIAPDVLERLFEPFFTTKPQGKGTGLGLATVHGIVRQSSGHVTVESTVGHGTQFTIYLPAFHSARPAAAAPPVHEAAHPVGQTVLVVDDEPAVRDVTMRALARASYRVLGAASGADALELLARERDPSMVLLLSDVMMPGMNGHELAAHVKTRFPQARLASMSGFSPDEIERQGFDTDSRLLLHKPFTLPQLIAFVNEIFAADRAVI
jgi:two-component system, cell cycle sensor histidine kinase and response regulator CckA